MKPTPLLLAATAAVVLAATMAFADLRVYEPFDYPRATDLDGLTAGGTNLAGQYATSSILDLVVASPGLDYGALHGPLPAPAGNRLSQTSGAGAGVSTVQFAQPLTTPAGSVLYFGALFTFNDASNLNRLANITLRDGATGDLIRFGEPSVGSSAIRVETQTVATGGNLVTDGADAQFVNGRTYWLLGRYHNSGTSGDDLLQLVGYDTTTAAALPADFDITDPAADFAFTVDSLDIDLTQLTAMELTIRGDANNFVDEIRLGDSWADITAIPEPSTLTGVLLLAPLALRRRGVRCSYLAMT